MAAFLSQASDWTALKTEITSDPEHLGYAGLNRNAIAALLNTPGNQLPTPQPWTKAAPLIPMASVLLWAAQPDTTVTPNAPAPMATIGEASANTSDPLYGQCMAALKMFDVSSAFDASNAGNLAVLSALVEGGKITANQQAAFLALATTPASRAENLWGAGTVITPDQVAACGG